MSTVSTQLTNNCLWVDTCTCPRAQLNLIMSLIPLGISDLLTRSPKKWICTLAWSIRRASISIVRLVSNLFLATSHEDCFSQSGCQDCPEEKSVLKSTILGCQMCHSVNTVKHSKQLSSSDSPAAKQSIASIVHISSVLCNCFKCPRATPLPLYICFQLFVLQISGVIIEGLCMH